MPSVTPWKAGVPVTSGTGNPYDATLYMGRAFVRIGISVFMFLNISICVWLQCVYLCKHM